MKKIIIALFVLLAFSGCINGDESNTTTTVTTATDNTTTTESTTTTTIPGDLPETGVVSASWLKDHLDDVLVVYVGKNTADRSDYDSGHIDGAIYLDAANLCTPAKFTYLGVDREVNCCVFGELDLNTLCKQSQLSGGFNYQVATKEEFEKLAGSLGVTKDKPVVVYGNPKDPYVARAFWDFAYYGQRVYYLDGGTNAWRYGTTMTLAEITPTNYTATPDESLRATADYVFSKLDDPNTAIVEVRTLKEHTGEKIYGNNLRGGNIPGSILLDWTPSNLNSDGTFKSKAELKRIYEAAGVTPDKEAITYCEGGVRASHSLLVLKYILGYPKVRNFEASWNEWGNAKNPDGAYKYPIEK